MSINNTKVIDKFNDNNMNCINYKSRISERNGKLKLNHIEVIEYFIRLIKPSNFLELGINSKDSIYTFINLIPGTYYNVNNNNINEDILYIIQNNKNFNYFNCTNDDYFNYLNINNIDLKLDMAFITSKLETDLNKDILNINKYLNDDGIIFIYHLNSDYKIIETIKKYYNNEYEILNIPINPGLTILRKCKFIFFNDKIN